MHHRNIKKIIGWGVALLIIVGVFFLVVRSAARNEQPYTAEPIHWHAHLSIKICGAAIAWSRGSAEEHFGTPLFHTHGDDVLHVEGRVIKKQDIMLGRFFTDTLKQSFDGSRLYDKKNGDACSNGKQGSVMMSVNDIPNKDFERYVIQANGKPEDQRIEIKFE